MHGMAWTRRRSTEDSRKHEHKPGQARERELRERERKIEIENRDRGHGFCGEERKKCGVTIESREGRPLQPAWFRDNHTMKIRIAPPLLL